MMRFGSFFLYELTNILLLTSCQKAEDIILSPDILPEEEEIAIVSQESTRTIAIIGDSISSFKDYSPSDLDGYSGAKYATYYPKGDVKNIDNMWWFKVAHSLGVTIDHICNCSWSGSRVTGNSSSTDSASAGCSTKRIMDLSVKDSILISCFVTSPAMIGQSMSHWAIGS